MLKDVRERDEAYEITQGNFVKLDNDLFYTDGPGVGVKLIGHFNLISVTSLPGLLDHLGS